MSFSVGARALTRCLLVVSVWSARAHAQWEPCLAKPTRRAMAGGHVVFVIDESASMHEPPACGRKVVNREVARTLAQKARDSMAALGITTSLLVFPGVGRETCTEIRPWPKGEVLPECSPRRVTPLRRLVSFLASIRNEYALRPVEPPLFVVLSDFEQFRGAPCGDDCLRGFEGAIRVRFPVNHSRTYQGDRCPSPSLSPGELDGLSVTPEELVARLAPATPDSPTPTETTTAFDLRDAVAIGDSRGFHCSGVAVSATRVLTARHCLPATRVAVAKDVRHPDTEIAVVATHVPEDPTFDVALLELATPIDVTFHPIRQPGDLEPPRGRLKLVGFGAQDSEGGRGFGTQHARADIAEGWGCDPVVAGVLGCRPVSELVLSGAGDRDTCRGDSGGPVFEVIRRDTQCNLRLVAITSRPVRNATVACGQGGIYSRVDVVSAWLTPFLTPAEEKSDVAR